MFSRNFLIWQLLIITCLSGCAHTPERLGFSDQEWAQLSESKQAEILASADRLSPRLLHDRIVPSYFNIQHLKVTVHSGKAYLWPKKVLKPFKTVTVTMSEGACRSIPLKAQQGSEQTELKACYRHQRLSIDPSPWQAEYQSGSAFFHASLLWLKGFQYQQVNTQGRAHLVNAVLSIQGVST